MTALNLTPDQERIAAVDWAEREYRNVDEFTGNDLDIAIKAYIAGRHAALAQSPVSADSVRLDWLQERGNQRGGLLLHAGNEESGGRTGLGLINTGRTLREAIDQARGIKAVATPMLAEGLEIKPIGAVLAYDSKGARGVHGQTIGADGSGQFVIVLHGTYEQADIAAREHVRSLERAGHRFNACILVHNEEAYHGPAIRHMDAAIAAADKGGA